MRKIAILLIILITIPLIFAWDDCPFGIANSSCSFPGNCIRYIDTNNNNICDRSEPVPSSVPPNSNIVQNNTSIPEELMDKYINISGRELKTHTIKEICGMYNINPENLKRKLKVNVEDDTTFYELKVVYGIYPSGAKEAIFMCMVEEGKIELNNTILKNTTTSENIQNNEKSFIDKVIEFLFMEINLKDMLSSLLKGIL
ncbi:hypothetical protein KKP97_01790 [Methanothermococcus sp. SCGC AD-155-C09]|nr:hypothetical protein [Methanothermococcus sp. SCGC AD-155-C09]